MKTRLSRNDWVQHGLKMLAKQGPTALRAEPMAKQLGVSRGSFYWHFVDIAEFEESIIDAWRKRTTNAVIDQLSDVRSPNARLKTLVVKAWKSDAALERMVRSWSATDKRLAKAVAAVDRQRLAYVEQLLKEMQVTAAEVRPRAALLYLASLGRFVAMDVGLRGLSAQDIERIVALVKD